MKKGGLYKRGNIWHAVWWQDGRQRWRSTKETNKSKAEAWLADRMAPLLASDRARALRAAADEADRSSASQAAKRMRLDEVWDAYRDAPQRGDTTPQTMQNHLYMWQAFLDWADPKPDTPATDITPTRAADYARHLREKTGATTFNGHVIFLRHVWTVLSRAGNDLPNPWKAIALKRSPPNSRRELTAEEIVRLMTQAEGEWRTLVAVGLYTGLRLSDCATLRWSEVDLAARLIRRTPKKTSRSSGKIVIIPIHDALMTHLAAAHPPWPEKTDKYVLPELARRITGSHNALHKPLSRIFDAAGIQRSADAVPSDRKRAPVEAGFHSLRHTFVSLCARAGVPQAVVQDIVGHSSAAMTRVYTHMGAEASRSAIACLPADFAPDRAQAPAPHAALPEWAQDRLRDMTEVNWSQIRDSMLASAPAAAVLTSTEPPGTTPRPPTPPAPACPATAEPQPAEVLPPATRKTGNTPTPPARPASPPPHATRRKQHRLF